jgi:hypothetical protein
MRTVKFDTHITVAIRASGERTAETCRKLIEAEIPAGHIVVVSEAPFEKATKQCYEAGIDGGLPWTLVVDADMLLRERAIEHLIQIAEKLDPNVFEIQGQVIDKLSGGIRAAGQHLYRTALLPKALGCIPHEGSEKRPENYVILRMASKGFPFLEIPQVLGLHDYEQWYRDVYRKAFFHAHKFSRAVRCWEPLWERLANDDPDFRIALLGLHAGLKYGGVIRSDIRQFPNETIDKLLRDHGFSEKETISPDEISAERIEAFIDTFVPAPEYWIWRSRSRESPANAGLLKQARSGIVRFGYFKMIPWVFGCLMAMWGKKLQDWAKR